MTTNIATDRRANLVGSAWMVLAMAAFAVEDTFIKAAAQSLQVGQILVFFGLGGSAVFMILSVVQRQRLFTADVVSTPMRLRVVFEIIGRLFFVLAITLTPLSSATVILQATPLVVVAGAALFFGETVGPRRWLAIVTGLVGVLVIIQPGADGFSLLSILAVIGMLGFAGRDLASRAAPGSLSASVLGFYGFLSIVAAGDLFALWEQTVFIIPETMAAIALCGAILAGVAAYTSLMKAMRTGEVSAVTSFRYTRLLFGIGFGVLLFDEQLDWPVFWGCGLIVVSGLFILWRGKHAET
ncbi:DMT family transporter [Roseobacter sp.]|uniref:DMT family transporter n=1 Tax=Roseobacter sp. TaxID=1907202 RepID=UPI00385E2620